MEISLNQLPPGDSRLVEAIVHQLKSKGIFDKFRKECLADVDTKPAFQNLRQRVDGHVKKYLGTKTWKSDMNKNQMRDGVRKDIQESGILDAGIDAIINQVVNPKITPLILPYVEDTVYTFLQIEKPKREPEDEHRYIGSQANIHHQPYSPNSMSYHGLPPHLQKNVYSDPPNIEQPKIKYESKESPKLGVKKEEIKEFKNNKDVIPMATDVISSEEDETLLYSNGNDPTSKLESDQHKNASDIKMEEDNAVDSFDSARKDSEIVTAAVNKLSIRESESHASMTKSEGATHNSLFDRQSLDSISSNSSNLSFSPETTKQKASGTVDHDVSPKGDVSMDELRSSQSTPLEDEKSVSSQTPVEYKDWGGSALPKDLPTAERITIASFGSYDQAASTNMVVSGASPVSAESQSSLDNSPSKDTSEPTTEDSRDSLRQKLILDDVSTSTSNSSSRNSTPRDIDSNSDKGVSSKSNSSDRKKKNSHDSKRKDSKHHKDRHHSKSRDDHSSHRKKDKYRKDRDDDSDKDRQSKSHYSSSSTHHRSSHSSSKDRRDKSSNHSSYHKSDKHGKNHKSGHHSSRDSKEKSYKRDTKEHKTKHDESKDRKKSSDSRSSDKVMTPKVNGTDSTISNNLLCKDKPLPNKSSNNEIAKVRNTPLPEVQNESKLKRNGSFTNKKKFINEAKDSNKETENKEKIRLSDSNGEKPKKPKTLLALNEDITLMGNLNKQKKNTNHKLAREPNKTISKLNGANGPNNKKLDQANELNNNKNKTEEVKDPNTKKIKIYEVKEANIKKNEFKEPNNNKDEKLIPGEKNKKIDQNCDEHKSTKLEKSPIKIIKNQFRNGKKIIKNVHNGISNGQTSVRMKRKLTINLEDISPTLQKRKQMKIEKPLILPPTNSQRLVICSFNASAKLHPSFLDDSDEGSDFEGFEPLPKRVSMESSDMFSDGDASILYDFEGFPDTALSTDNKVRNYLTRMNRVGNCSRYND